MNSVSSEYDIKELYQEAQGRWLKPAEVFFILQNHEKYKITQEPAKQPTSGSLYLFNKRVLRFFRKDGHNWRKKKDGRTVGEAHERLKVGNVEMLNCYYAHGEENNNFQRRSYWMLDPAYEHIVLVHYRDITEGNPSSVFPNQRSSASILSFGRSPSPSSPHNAGSISVNDYQSLTSPPGSFEVSSDTVIPTNGMDHKSNSQNGSGEFSSSTNLEVSHALRKLEEQLSLNDDSFQDFGLSPGQIEESNVSDLMGYNQNQFEDFRGSQNVVQNSYYHGYPAVQGGGGEIQNQYIGQQYSYGSKESETWKDVLDSCHTSAVESQQNEISFNRNEPEFTRDGTTIEPEHQKWQNSSTSSADHTSPSVCQEVNSFGFSQYPSTSGITGTNSDYYGMLLNQGHIGVFEPDVSLTIAQKQKFKILEISPAWGFASESTTVLIVGSFLCDSWESTWNCMFGDVEVPAQIIQEGVLRCEAPPHSHGKVTLCITSGNRESCSEVREFEYRLRGETGAESNSPSLEPTRNPEELLFLVKLVQMLLSDSPEKKKKDITDVDLYASVIEALSLGSGTCLSTIDWLLEELLKDKIQNWISSKSWKQYSQNEFPLTRKEQGIIHLVAGLGYEWALSPILSAGVSVNFRDIKGWTALHWAARFGREKMVAALIASGASAEAVTDPSSENRTGETAAAIAAGSGHKGLAGYLSEMALTSHLSSLTLRESELSKGSAELEAEKTMNIVSRQNLVDHGDHVSLKHTLAAVRNSAQAAARIQSAFRAHSFRRKQVSAISTANEYGMNEQDIQEISAMSKLRNPRDHNCAALSIQKKYRGYKGRKDYLSFRQNVVKIQAHVRGYQVRKHYKVFCWAVGVLEKVVLRWRRKGVGLRGFRPENDSIDESESEDEDILKSFRKQKVDGAIKMAISRVVSMVKSTEAREQYLRVLQKYCQARAALGGTSNEAAQSDDISDFCDVIDFDL